MSVSAQAKARALVQADERRELRSMGVQLIKELSVKEKALATRNMW